MVVLAANVARSGQGWIYTATLAAQLALLVAALLARRLPRAPLRSRPLLRDDDRLDRRRPLGPLAPRRLRALGEGRGHPLMPRAVDLLIATLALVVLSPFLLAAAIAIKLGSRGPVVYRQRRVGRDGARVRDVEAVDGRSQGSDPVGVGTIVSREDPRVTAAGRFLRRTSLDEVPNLVNVLRGEMAIVGPRPTIPAQVDDYTPHQNRRHEVLPRNYRLGPGPGPRRHPLGGADRARRPLRGAAVSAALDARILAKTLWLRHYRQGPRPRLTLMGRKYAYMEGNRPVNVEDVGFARD